MRGRGPMLCRGLPHRVCMLFLLLPNNILLLDHTQQNLLDGYGGLPACFFVEDREADGDRGVDIRDFSQPHALAYACFLAWVMRCLICVWVLPRYGKSGVWCRGLRSQRPRLARPSRGRRSVHLLHLYPWSVSEA